VILTVTLNPALDLTYRVPALSPGGTHRVSDVAERAGGKGVNVARVLHALGEPVIATGLAGGRTGERIRELLAADGVPEAFAPIAGESRRTVVVADGAGATGFWEPGPAVPAAEWTAFRRRFTGLLGVAHVVVLAGSLPDGIPADAYAVLIGLARAAGVPVVLDADGDPLRLGVAAGPDLVKPNAAELAGLLGRPVPVPTAAREVRALGAREAVASLGGAGLVAATVDGDWRASLPHPLDGNPTGAGDACVAALARGLAHRQPWPDRLVDAVALAGSAVAAPVAGAVSISRWRRLRQAVTVCPVQEG
jgi:tagatose 6-phosphate kinase